MYPRLVLMKQLLKLGGVLFISIDDNEAHHLRLILDEIFDNRNFIGEFS
jgi:adenine-specific DNA-methyltransferase